MVAHYGRRGTLRDIGLGTQTVPRAELEAINVALLTPAEIGHIREIAIYSDCKSVVD